LHKKTTQAEIDAVCELYREGLSYQKIANRLKIGVASVEHRLRLGKVERNRMEYRQRPADPGGKRI